MVKSKKEKSRKVLQYEDIKCNTMKSSQSSSDLEKVPRKNVNTVTTNINTVAIISKPVAHPMAV
jgi:hypothetical protein